MKNTFNLREREPRPLAAFDLDGTLFKTSMLEAVYDQAVQRRYIPSEEIVTLELLREEWTYRQNTEESYTAHVNQMVRTLLAAMTDRTERDMHEIVGFAIEKQLRMRHFVKEAMRILGDTHHIVIISASLREITRLVLNEVYRQDDAMHVVEGDLIFGSVWQKDDRGFYTGTGETIDKKSVVGELLDRPDFIWERSCAFGDTISDAPMLQAVEFGVMVNPSTALREACQSICWRVRESKDETELIYPHLDENFRGTTVRSPKAVLELIGLTA